MSINKLRCDLLKMACIYSPTSKQHLLLERASRAVGELSRITPRNQRGKVWWKIDPPSNWTSAVMSLLERKARTKPSQSHQVPRNQLELTCPACLQLSKSSCPLQPQPSIPSPECEDLPSEQRQVDSKGASFERNEEPRVLDNAFSIANVKGQSPATSRRAPQHGKGGDK